MAPSKKPLLGHDHDGHHDGHDSNECHNHAHGAGCQSKMHTPGMCHGFEAKKTGKTWTVIHDKSSLDEYLSRDSGGTSDRAVLLLGAAAAAVFGVMLLEFAVGFVTGSLALYNDAAHQLSDFLLYLVLMASVHLSLKEVSISDYSFGHDRAQVLGSFMALLLQYFITGLVIAQACERLWGDQREINGKAVFFTSGVSLGVNLLLLRTMPESSTGHGHSHGSGSAATSVAQAHIYGDLFQSGTCILVGLLVWINPENAWMDSASVFVYGATVLWSSFRLFQEFFAVLMERAPLELKSNEMFSELARIKGVLDVHCCHVWMLAPGKIAMSAHLHIEDDCHEDVLHKGQILLQHKYGILHSTLQISEDEDLA